MSATSCGSRCSLPTFIAMILDGRQPPALQFEALRKSLPLLWDEQRRPIRGES
jgi:hypothetical protein